MTIGEDLVTILNGAVKHKVCTQCGKELKSGKARVVIGAKGYALLCGDCYRELYRKR